jgi:hypothetical protein
VDGREVRTDLAPQMKPQKKTRAERKINTKGAESALTQTWRLWFSPQHNLFDANFFILLSYEIFF